MHLIFHIAAEWQRIDKPETMTTLWLQEESRKKGGAKIQPPAIETRATFYEKDRSVVQSIRSASPSTTIIISSWDLCKTETRSLKSALDERRHAQVILICLRPYLRLDPKTEETTTALYLLEQSIEASKKEREVEIKKAWEKEIEEGLHERVIKQYCRLEDISDIARKNEIPETRVRRIILKHLKPQQRERVEKRKKEKQRREKREYKKGALPTQSIFDPEMIQGIGLSKETDLWRLIYEHIMTRATDRTRQVVTLTWKHFFNFMEERYPKRPFTKPDDIREEDIKEWSEHMYGLVKKNTAATRLYHLKGFFSFIIDRGETGRTPFAGFKIPRHQRHAVKAEPLSRDEIRAILKRLEEKVDDTYGKDWHWRALRLRALVRLFLWTGARASSLLCLRLIDLKFEINFVKVTMMIKGGTSHEVELPEKAMQDLKAYIEEVHGDGWSNPDNFLFYADLERRNHPYRYDALWLELNALGEELDIKALSSHRFRTTFATESMNAGVDPHQVQVMMGLKSYDQMLFYVKKKKTTYMPAYMEDVS
jgi:site-specific recombinase XerD